MGDVSIAVVGGLFDEDEDENHRSSNGTESPPENKVPRVIVGDEASKCSTAYNSEDNHDFENSKGLSTLVQEEHVNDVSAAQNGRNTAEQTGEESGDGERNVVIDASHLGTPDLTSEDAHETPKDDGASSDHSNKGNKEEGTGDPASKTSRYRVKQVVWCLVISWHLRHESEHVRIGRHLSCEGSQTDRGEDDDLLSQWPVLYARMSERVT